MSTRVMSACWPLQMPPSPKSVLISLADNANDQGECWPALATIGERTCLGKTAVINAIKWLEGAGLVMADRTNGRHSRYVIDLRVLDQAQMFGNEPVREADRFARRTGSAAVPDQSARRTAPVREADTNRKEPSRTKEQKQPPPSAEALPACPEWLDAPAWEGFVAMRKRIRHPLTAYAAELIFKALQRFQAQGMNVNDVLDQSTRNGWRDVFALRETNQAITTAGGKPHGKQMQGLMALEDMKNAARQRMAAAGNSDGPAETLHALAGPNTRR